MQSSQRNPAATGIAGRAPKWFCWAAETNSEDSSARSGVPDRRRDFNAEARIPASIVAWVRPVAPELLIFALSNGGRRSRAEAAGVPDLAIVASGTIAADYWPGCRDRVRERLGLRRRTAPRLPIKDTVAEAAPVGLGGILREGRR
jgi:hypothetical protein